MSYFGNILRIKVYYIDNFKDSILIETVFSDAISLNFVSRDFCDRSSIIKWIDKALSRDSLH